jgi:uncharacterized surface protein with fasciclin (FAS1) repeats
MKYLKSTLAIILAVGMLAACHKKNKNNMGMQNKANSSGTTMNNSLKHGPVHTNKNGTIVDIASHNSHLKMFVSALKSAGKSQMLSQKGPYTVFAPNNKAFKAIPKATRKKLMSTQTQKLGNILAYHVVKGSYKASDLKDGQMLTTVNGKKLKVTKKNGMVMINGAKVVSPNLKASNGMVHIINKVLMPSKH